MAKETKKKLLDSIKERIKNSGGGKEGLFYVKGGTKRRVRFLEDFEEGHKMLFHSKWGFYNHPCLKYFGLECENHNDDEAKHTDNFFWSVYDNEAKKVLLSLYKANRSSPLPRLVEIYEEYGTITEMDLVISRTGVGTDTSYGVLPRKEADFLLEGKKIAFSKAKIMDIMKKCIELKELNDDNDDEEFEEEEEVKPKKKTKANKKPPWKEEEEEDEEYEDDEEDEYEDDEEEEEEEVRPRKKKRR